MSACPVESAMYSKESRQLSAIPGAKNLEVQSHKEKDQDTALIRLAYRCLELPRLLRIGREKNSVNKRTNNTVVFSILLLR